MFACSKSTAGKAAASSRGSDAQRNGCRQAATPIDLEQIGGNVRANKNREQYAARRILQLLDPASDPKPTIAAEGNT